MDAPRRATRDAPGRKLRGVRPPSPSCRRRPLSGSGRRTVGIVECAVVADQFGLCEGGRLLVAIPRPGHEGLEGGQLLHTRCAALVRVQMYELARVREIEDRVAKTLRARLCELLEHRAHESCVLIFAAG